MGLGRSGPQPINLINQYIDNLPILPQNVGTGQEVFNYYMLKNQFTEISMFNNPRFQRKIQELQPTPQQAERLWYLVNRVNSKAQAQFQAKFPKA